MLTRPPEAPAVHSDWEDGSAAVAAAATLPLREESAGHLTAAEQPVDSTVGRQASLAQRLWRKAALMAPTLGSSFLLFAILVVQAVFLARALDPEGRGEYAAVISYTRLLTYIGLLGVNFAIVRRAAQADGSLVNLSRAALRAGLVTGLLTMAVVACLALFALPAGKEHLAGLAILCAVTLPLEHARLNLIGVDQGSGNFRRFNAGRLVAAAAAPILLGLAWACGILTVTTATLLLIPATAIGLAFRLIWNSDRQPWRRGNPTTKTLVREGLPYASSQTASDLFNRLDTVLILWLATTTQQGLYAAAVPAVQILTVAPEALAVFAFNAGARHKRGLSRKHLIALAGSLLLFQGLAAGLYATILKWLMILVYSIHFAAAVPLALALLPGLVCQGCTVVADGYLRGRGHAGLGIRARFAGAIVMGVAALILYRNGNELAVPMAASIGNLACALWMGWSVLTETQQPSSPAAPSISE